MIVLVILTTSGCAVSQPLVKNIPDKVLDAYMSGVGAGQRDAAGFITENLKISKAFGYVKPYVPVIEPADVRMVWLPAHKSKNDPNTLVGGHWVYIMVRESRWFIDAQVKDNAQLPVIIPYKEEAKK